MREREVGPAPGDERETLLDPVDRISEVLFGLIMAMTIVGSISIATAGQAEALTVAKAALGCNLAWGLVDAVMYVVRTVTERSRYRVLGRRIRTEDAATAHRLISQALPEHLAAIVEPSAIEDLRRRLLALPAPEGALLRLRDLVEAAGIFAMVVLATFPVVAPFWLSGDAAFALLASQIITLAMLLVLGVALGRYAGHPRPIRTGIVMAVFGALLIVVVKALGG